MHFLLSEGFNHNGLNLHWYPQVTAASGLPNFDSLPTGFSLVSAVVETLEPPPYQVRTSRTQEDPYCPRGVLSLGHSQGLRTRWGTSRNITQIT